MIDLPPSTRIISCDVFDTLLLRNGRCEASRVRRIADHAAALIARETGAVIAPAALAAARADVQRYAYRGLDMVHPCGEVGFAALMAALARVLGLPPHAAPLLAAAEIAVEKRELAPNRALLGWLAIRAQEGLPVIAISDIWHDAATIRDLLDTLAPGHPVLRVYTSADLGATKRSGAIFPLVAAHEGLDPAAFLHIGDDTCADVKHARAAGLAAHQLHPPRLTVMRRKLDGAWQRARRALPAA